MDRHGVAATVAVIVLAAGRGSRFGADPESSKVVAPFDGTTLVRRVAETALASRASQVVAVTGHAAGPVGAALAGLPIVIVHNEAAASGLAGSLQVGLAALPPAVDAALIMLADMPLVRADTLDRLIARFELEADRLDALVPCIAGRAGNPVLLSRRLFGDIAQLRGDAGARQMLAENRRSVAMCEVDDPGIEIDVDTRQALSDLAQSELAQGPGRS